MRGAADPQDLRIRKRGMATSKLTTTSRLFRRTALAILLLSVSLVEGCSRDRESRGLVNLPTAPSQIGQAKPDPGSVGSSVDAPFRLVGNSELRSDTLAAFPPRNEPFQFRQTLESYYQTTLRRGPVQTAVDLEGSIVWTQDYLRFRLSGCDHATAVSRVLVQIDGAGSPPECGGVASFPPRNEALDFRSNHLESKYRNGLRRNPTTTYVDIEGDVVWTTEYFRYRLSGCDHENATQKTLTQVGGNTAPATCQTMLAIWTSASSGWSSISVTVNGRAVGALTRFFEPGIASACTALEGARVVAVVAPGVVTFDARSNLGATWSGSRTLVSGECRGVELTCTNRNCGPISAPPPAPRTPTPPPPPPPPLPPTSSVIESRIDGTFEGWDGDTIFKLQNGQIWQQSSYAYTYHYAYSPKVIIYWSGFAYRMQVEGVSGSIQVTRLR